MRLSDNTAGTLAWLSVLLLVPGALVMSPTGRILFLGLAALAALVPLIFGSAKRRLFGGAVLAVSVVIGVPTYLEHQSLQSEYLERAKQRR